MCFCGVGGFLDEGVFVVGGHFDDFGHAVDGVDLELDALGEFDGVVVVADAVEKVVVFAVNMQFEHDGPVLVVYSAGAGAFVGGVVHGFDVQAGVGVVCQ